MEARSIVGLTETSVAQPQIFLLLTVFSVCCSLWERTFYLFMDVKTFITVQGQCRGACIKTETAQVATRDGLSLEVRANIANV